jgi:hypothetical protein
MFSRLTAITRRGLTCLLAASTLAEPLIAGSDSADGRPAIFSPGVISGAGSNYAPAFARDPSFVLFSHKTDQDISILISSRRGDDWSPPEAVPFSGKWVDLESALSSDGSYVIFASNRPVSSGGTPLRAYYAGSDQIGGNLWRVDFAHGEWGQPRRLSESVNSSFSVWTPSIARNGDLYFMSTDAVTGRFRLHVAPVGKNGYAPTKDLTFSTGGFNDVDPVVDPGQRFLIFSSDRAHPGVGVQAGPERLFIVFEPRAAAPLICSLAIPGWNDTSVSQVEARLSHDGATLYFASRRPGSLAGAAPSGAWDDGKVKIWMTPLRPKLWRTADDLNGGCRARSAI